MNSAASLEARSAPEGWRAFLDLAAPGKTSRALLYTTIAYRREN